MSHCPDCGATIPQGSADCLACIADAPYLSAPVLSSRISLPHSFGKYRLLQELGRGGMGVVFRAEDTVLRREVALKAILGSYFASEETTERFRKEAEIAASLEHEGIVAIYEIGQPDEPQYFTMRLIEGQSLAEKLAAGALEQTAVADLMARLARTVHFAHQRGVLHRDLKPSNILIDCNDSPYLTDFGIAKVFNEPSNLTLTGDAIGTPAYMSPEQAAGGSKRVTTLTDVYGLGAILYHALTGVAPFHPQASLAEVIQNEPKPPRSIRPTLDPDLEAICLKSIEKQPARRYSSALELAEDLERWLRKEPIQARRVGPVSRALRWVRRNPLWTALGTSLLVGGMLAGGLGLQWKRNRQMTVLTLLKTAEAHLANDRADQGLLALAAGAREYPDNRAITERLVNVLRQRVFFVPLGVRQEAADIASKSKVSHHLRILSASPTSIQILNASNEVVLSISNAHTKVIRSRQLSADGDRIVSASADGSAKLWDAHTGLMLLAVQTGAGLTFAELSRDGNRLVTASRDGLVRFWDARNGKPIGQAISHASAVNSVRFSPDGQRVVTTSDDGVCRIWDASTGSSRSEPLRLDGFPEDARFQEDGDTIVVRWNPGLATQGDEKKKSIVAEFKLSGGLNLWRTEPGVQDGPLMSKLDGSGSYPQAGRLADPEILRKAATLDPAANSAALSSDQLRLAISTSDRRVRIWDVVSLQPLSDWIASTQAVSRVWFSGSNEWLNTSAGWRWQYLPANVTPAWLPELAEVIARPLPDLTKETGVLKANRLGLLREELGKASLEDPLVAWAHELIGHDAPTN